MHIQEVFNAIYKNHHYEYLVIDKNMEVIEFSDRIIDYCDVKLLKNDCVNLYVLVPELYGLESQFEDFFNAIQSSINIPFVRKGEDRYVNISVHQGRKDNLNSIETLIILFENVTESVFLNQRSVQDRNEKELLLFELEKKNVKLREFNDHMKELVEAETSKNLKLSQEIITTQQVVIATMGAIGESRSQETGDHVLRVAEYFKLLALKFGINEQEAENLKLASPMHDIGKIGIPDSILKKPAKLTEEEYEIMKTHTLIGFKMLSGSNQKLLQAASIVAHEHHEKWNGQGYPRGLVGEEIHIYGRITAIVDVFDALGHSRVYKDAWPHDEIIEFLLKERGKHFDPYLLDIFIENINDFIDVKNSFINIKTE